MNRGLLMRRSAPFFLAFALLFTGCEEKKDDPSDIEKMVLLEEDEEDGALVQDPQVTGIAKEAAPAPQEQPFMEEEDTLHIR